MSTSRSVLRGERGQTLIEFALALWLFLMTIFGIVELGLGVWQYNMVSNLAQDGARWASVRGSTAGTVATNASVQTYVQGRVPGMSPTVTTTWPDGGSQSNAPGNRVQVVVQKSFTPLTALIPNATLTLQSTAQMIIAR